LLSFAPRVNAPESRIAPTPEAGPQDRTAGNGARLAELGLSQGDQLGGGSQGLGPIEAGLSGMGNVAAPAVTAPNGGGARPMIRMGSNGPSVTECQRRLNLHGADLHEDGQFGPLTDAAVREFQGRSALVADGVVGPLTWSALDQGLGPLGHGGAPGSQHQVAPAGGSATGERLLDESNFLIHCITADSSELAPYVSMGALDTDLASTLAGMRDLDGDAYYSYELAIEGLSDASLLGIVHQSSLPSLLNRRLSPNDPDRATFAAARATSKGAVCYWSRDGARALIVVADDHSYSSRSEALSLAHELNHFRNRGAPTKAVEADQSRDLAGTGTTLTAAQLAETRRAFVHEVVARHVEWWAAWDIRNNRTGASSADTVMPAPGALLQDCLTLAIDAATTSGSVYDPYGYWASLINKPDSSLDDQVKGWIQLVHHETFSGNPYRDILIKMNFAAAAVATPIPPGDGLDGDI
jgi:hypothetical protein